MSIENDQVFEFGPFVLDPLAQTLVKDGEEVPLPPKAFAVLLVLVRNAGRPVKKDQIHREVWPDVFVEDQNISLYIHLARKAVGDDAKNPTYIASLSRRGYRFIAPVVKRDRVASCATTGDANPSVADALPQPTLSLKWLTSAVAEDRWFLLATCTLYALLYAIALFVEVAYQFDSYGASAVRVAPLVFVWVWTTSFAGLILCTALTLNRRAYSLALTVSLFVASVIVLYVSVGWILPNAPITKALFQTYPARGGYLKSISHFLPLAVIFLVVPYHFVIAARTQIRLGNRDQIRKLLSGERFGTAPEGTVFLKVKWLCVMLTIAAIASIVATAHLMDNLVATEYTSMFVQLIQWRMLVYFSLGVICILWYSRSLNSIKIASLKMYASSQPLTAMPLPPRPVKVN